MEEREQKEEMKREIVSIAVMLMLFVSMFLSLPLVSAAHTVEEHHMPLELQGDANMDGIVDGEDLGMLGQAWGSHVGDPNYDSRCDFNGDGMIGGQDLGLLGQNWGKTMNVEPVAYSTTFEFMVPDDGNEEVWYYVLARVYVPSELSGENFYFMASADDSVQNVKLDDVSKAGSGSSVNIDLGTLSSGYHLLEFEYVETIAAGVLNFHVATTAEKYAWLTRFRVYVPNYSDNPYEYMVTTTTWCFMKDDYFLLGFADDFIDDVCVDGTVWQDWEWNCTPYDTIYAWGDGFCYPLGNLENNTGLNAYATSFKFGEICAAGLLDFQYVSWTKQKDRIGPPRFRAVGNLNPADYITINSAMFYGGSEWKFEDDPEFSERYFETREVIDVKYDDGEYRWFNTNLEIGLGLGWTEWALLPATEDDVGITLNFTATHFNTSMSDLPCFWYELVLGDPTIDIYSFPALEIEGIEYEEHDSFVKADLTSAMDYTGGVIMFVSSTQGQPIGALTGLGIKGLAAIIKITEGQHVSRFNVNTAESHHYQVLRSHDFSVCSPPQGEISAISDIIFFKLNPVAGRHCGLTQVVLQGTLECQSWYVDCPVRPLGVYPIADITITIYTPWLLRG